MSWHRLVIHVGDRFGHDRGARQRPPYEECCKSPSPSMGSARFWGSFFRERRVVRSARSDALRVAAAILSLKGERLLRHNAQCATALARQASRHLPPAEGARRSCVPIPARFAIAALCAGVTVGGGK